MKLNYSKRILIVSILAFALVLILDITFTNLLSGKIRSIQDKNKQIALSSQERERNLALKESVINSEAERQVLEQYFVPAGDAKTAEFISQLEAQAKAAGLAYTVKSVGYTAITGIATSSQNLTALKFKFSVRHITSVLIYKVCD